MYSAEVGVGVVEMNVLADHLVLTRWNFALITPEIRLCYAPVKITYGKK